jgi:hypothetical protein
MKAEDFGALETAKLFNGPLKTPSPWEDRFKSMDTHKAKKLIDTDPAAE